MGVSSEEDRDEERLECPECGGASGMKPKGRDEVTGRPTWEVDDECNCASCGIRLRFDEDGYEWEGMEMGSLRVVEES